MRRTLLKYHVLTTICAILAITLILSMGASGAAGSPSLTAASAVVDLSSESRTLAGYVTDLGRFDKKGAELGKKAKISSQELASQQRIADDLRRRLSIVQNALQQVVAKLKSAGEWDGLDAKILAKVRDAKFQDVARQESFKRVLEEFASNLTNNANEIGDTETLRRKVGVQTRDPLFERGSILLASRAIRVAYEPAPAMLKASFKCRLAWLRRGLAEGFGGTASQIKGVDAVGCYCSGDQQACDALAAE